MADSELTPPTFDMSQLTLSHQKSNQYRASEGHTFQMSTPTGSFHSVEFDAVLMGPMTLNLPVVSTIGALGLGMYSLIVITTSTVGDTLRFQTTKAGEYINHGTSSTFDFVTDGTRKMFMVLAPGLGTNEFKNRWIIRHFGSEVAALNISDLAAGADISIVEGPAGIYTIANTAPDQVRTITGGAGIEVTGSDPSFTISMVDQWQGHFRYTAQLLPFSFVGGLAGVWTDVPIPGTCLSPSAPAFQNSVAPGGIEFVSPILIPRLFKASFGLNWTQTWPGPDLINLRLVVNGGAGSVPGIYSSSLISPFPGLQGANFGMSFVQLSTNDIVSLQIKCDVTPNVTLDISEFFIILEAV